MNFILIENFTDRKLWLEWRQKGIGASDAPIIMGVSRFKTREQLLIEKANEGISEEPNTYITERGQKVEFQVRMFLEQRDGCAYPACNATTKAFEFLRASLDGVNNEKDAIVEIKLLASVKADQQNITPGLKKWNELKEGKVPDEYYPQVQHQLAVTGAEKCIFVGYKEIKGNLVVTPDKLAIVTVYPDKNYIRELLKKEFEFWLDVWEMKKKLQYKGELD